MATSNIAVTEGSGKNIATNSFSEDAITKQVQRTVINTSAGVESGTSGSPFQVSLANTGANGTKILVTPDLPSGASTAAKQPALGTAGTASSDVITVQGIASMTALKVDGSAVSQPVVGNIASGSSDSGAPTKIGGKAINAEITAVTNAQRVDFVADLVGKQIVMPYANKENFVSGVATATGTSGTSVIAAQGAGVKIYITNISVANTGSTSSLITIQSDPAGTPVTMYYTINPSGGGSNINFTVPLVVPANKAVGFTAGSSSTTQYVSISGYIGS